MRTTERDVLDLIDTDLEEREVTPFLRTANVVVTDAVGDDADYSSDLLEQLELWLAAHFVAIRDPRVVSETIGDAKATYHGKSGLGLDHTPYGQQLRVIDTKGTLVAALVGITGAHIEACP